METKKIGIVLSSGGGRGIFGHTGFLLSMDKLDIPVSAMSGSSAGAVVGGVVASGTPIAQWATDIVKAHPRQYWKPKSLLKLIFLFIVQKGRGFWGISPPSKAIEFCNSHLTATTFERCQYPFYAVAVNLGNGKKEMISKGPLARGIMASAAMPVLYEPVEIDGQYYTDGAIIDLAPADAICCRHGLDLLIIHHVAQREYTSEGLMKALTKPWTIVDILHRLIYRTKPWYATGKPSSQHKCPCGCGADILVIEPTLPELVWPVTEGGQEIIDRAKQNAEEQLRGTNLLTSLGS